GAGRRAGLGVREIPGLAPRLAAALGSRRRSRRSASDPLAPRRPRPPPPRAPDPGLPRPLRGARRAAAGGPAAATVGLRHAQRLARRAAGDRDPGARGYAALLRTF